MAHKPPARGVVAGIREDARRAKEGGAYDPRGVGVAWSHGFLNQKPWHPSSFRNQQRKFEAEARAMEKAKRIEEGKHEFEAEQEHFKSLSYMSTEAQKKYQDRQSLAFMYMKPPGLEAALRKEEDAVKKKEREEKKAQEGAGERQAEKAVSISTSTSVVGPGGPATFSDKGPVRTMLQGCALQEVGEQSVQMLSRTNPYGGFASTADNQQLVVGTDDVVGGPQEQAGMDSKQLRKLRRAQKREKRKLEVAHARSVLEEAGYDVDALTREVERSRHSGKRAGGRRKDKKSRRSRDVSPSQSPDRRPESKPKDRFGQKRARGQGGRESGRRHEDRPQ